MDGWRKRAHIANRIDDRRATGVAVHSDYSHTQKEKKSLALDVRKRVSTLRNVGGEATD